MAEHLVRLRTWIKASAADERTGLIGWISVEYGSLLIDNITLRRTSAGRLTLSFPTRTAKNGQKHAVVRPLDDVARREVERVILEQLAEREELGVVPEDPDE
jgi:DNA-binding cell septation regulator SpoVG